MAVAAGAITVYCLAVLVPWQTSYYDADLGVSTQAVLHEAFASKMKFGKDIVYTLGPLGFLQDSLYHPATFVLRTAIRTFFALVTGWAAWRVGLRFTRRPLFHFAWLVLVVSIMAEGPDVEFVALSQLTFLYYFYVDDRPLSATLVLLVLAITLAGLVKVNLLMLAGVVCLLISLDLVIRKRNRPWPILLLVAAFLSFWILEGQSLSTLWDFAKYSLEFVKGYEAMARDGPPMEIVGYLIVSGLLVGLAADVEWRHRRFLGALPVGILALMLFMDFKHGFTRHDAGHGAFATAALCCTTLLYVAAAWPLLQSRRRRVMACMVAAGSLALFWVSLTLHSESTLTRYLTGTVRSVGPNLRAAIGPRHALEEKYVLAMKNIRADNPLPPLHGSVDIYPYHQTILFAHGLEYKPRPTILSYLTFSPVLGKLNAERLLADGAQYVLFRIKALDNSYPSLEDSLSWPQLLTHYDAVATAGTFLVLDRSSHPRKFGFASLGSFEIEMGSVAQLDLEGPVWAELDIRKTWFGRLASALLKSPNLSITIWTRGGLQQDYRLILPMAKGGFLLSPLIDNAQSFALLGSTDWQRELEGMKVTRFAIHASSPRLAHLCYQPRISVRLSRLDFPRQDLSHIRGLSGLPARLENLRRLAAGFVFAQGPPQIMTGPDGSPVLYARAPSQTLLPVSVGATKIQVGFGLLDKAWREGTSDGVEFRVSTATTADELTLLWSRRLDPLNRETDRGVQWESIQLPTGVTRLVLETLPGTSDERDWSFWAEATVDY